MSKSLFYQFNSALDMCFVLHFDKHSDKHNPQADSDHIIKSLSAKSNLKDFAHDFAAFIKNEYGVKQIKEITPEMCQNYINSKYESSSLQSIKAYKSSLLKISQCANKCFNIPAFIKYCKIMATTKTTPIFRVGLFRSKPMIKMYHT